MPASHLHLRTPAGTLDQRLRHAQPLSVCLQFISCAFPDLFSMQFFIRIVCFAACSVNQLVQPSARRNSSTGAAPPRGGASNEAPAPVVCGPFCPACSSECLASHQALSAASSTPTEAYGGSCSWRPECADWASRVPRPPQQVVSLLSNLLSPSPGQEACRTTPAPHPKPNRLHFHLRHALVPQNVVFRGQAHCQGEFLVGAAVPLAVPVPAHSSVGALCFCLARSLPSQRAQLPTAAAASRPPGCHRTTRPATLPASCLAPPPSQPPNHSRRFPAPLVAVFRRRRQAGFASYVEGQRRRRRSCSRRRHGGLAPARQHQHGSRRLGCLQVRRLRTVGSAGPCS